MDKEPEITFELDNEGLNDLVAECHNWELRSFAGEDGWVDEDGHLIQLRSSYNPAGNMNFALELMKELNDEGYCIAINTKDLMTGNDILLITGAPVNPGLKALAEIRMELYGEVPYKEELCRGICLLYTAYKGAHGLKQER